MPEPFCRFNIVVRVLGYFDEVSINTFYDFRSRILQDYGIVSGVAVLVFVRKKSKIEKMFGARIKMCFGFKGCRFKSGKFTRNFLLFIVY